MNLRLLQTYTFFILFYFGDQLHIHGPFYIEIKILLGYGLRPSNWTSNYGFLFFEHPVPFFAGGLLFESCSLTEVEQVKEKISPIGA